MNKIIRLTESDLKRIVEGSLNRILKETYDPCDELGCIRWRKRDYRNNSDDAQRVGKKRGEALANWNKRVKDSENKTVEEGYTSNVSYTDANAPSNRPQTGTPEYYRRNDRMQVGQQPMYNNPNNWDNTKGWYSERSQNRRDSQPFNSNMYPRSANPMSNMSVEESVDEVMYNGVSYHGTNPYDWVDIADERSQMGWKNRDDVSKYNQARFKAKDQGDLEGAEAASIMADKHRQQWNKNWGAAERNRNNAKQLGWQGQNDTRLGKAQEYYNMSQNAQNPQDRQRYNQMAQNTLGDVEGRANQALKRLRGENVIKRAVKESVQKILKEDNGSYRGIVLLDTGNSEEDLRQNIDAWYNKGMSTEQIQNAVNWWANWWNNQSDEYRKLCQP